MRHTFAKPRELGRPVRLPCVCHMTAFSPATVWRKVKNDPRFPRPFKLSEGVTCWDEAEILGWVESRKSERGAQ